MEVKGLCAVNDGYVQGSFSDTLHPLQFTTAQLFICRFTISNGVELSTVRERSIVPHDGAKE